MTGAEIATSIAETGARSGDKVKCVGTLPTGETFRRFIEGRTYTVIGFCGSPCAYGHVKADGESVGIPARGYGYKWVLANV